MATIQIRIDEELKSSTKEILNDLGLDMSSAIKMFLVQVKRKKAIPFKIVTENGFTPEQEEEMIRESKETIRAYKAGKLKGYDSAEEMIKDILG